MSRPRRRASAGASAARKAGVDVSIVICTRDRCHHLRESLDRVVRARVPDGWRVELIVVDNGSSDATRAVVEALQAPQMEVRYVFEPRRGKGHAYNAGLAAARGAAFLLTDDDTRVPADWIEGMCAPILAGEADAVQGGITIAPHLERPWLKGVLRVWVAEVAHPDRPPEGLVGANMAFGRKALAAAGPFDVRLGPGAAGFFDDTVFGWAIEAAGQKILFRPSVAVEHHFDPDRLSLAAFMSSARNMAASRVLILRDQAPDAPPPGWPALFGQLPRLAVRSATQAARYVLGRQPDPGFLYWYYRLCLWRALRAQAS
jgi:glycosyltransferase involved in cell wall biosynthesis